MGVLKIFIVPILNHLKFYEWAQFIVIIGFIVAYVVAHKMTLIEIGDDKAKNLGTAIIPIKITAIIATIFLVAPSIILVGNVAFVGSIDQWLFCKKYTAHDYRLIMPLSHYWEQS